MEGNFCTAFSKNDEIFIDLDHDIGLDGSGYDICKYIVEHQILLVGFHIHSMNPVGKAHILGLKDRYFPPFNEDFFFERGDYADHDCE